MEKKKIQFLNDLWRTTTIIYFAFKVIGPINLQ